MEGLEIWKPITGYEGLYEVSNHGRVKSLTRHVRTKGNTTKKHLGKILKPFYASKKDPYVRVSLSKGPHRWKTNVHRLVAAAFIPNPEEKPEVNHIDGNKSNNHVSNLEWVTRKENAQHAVATGLIVIPKGPRPNRRGSNHHASRPVVQLTLNGELVKVYESINLVHENGFKQGTVHAAINYNKTNISKGFRWMYKEDYESQEETL